MTRLTYTNISCSVKECDKPRSPKAGKGLCSGHYSRYQKTGIIGGSLQTRPPKVKTDVCMVDGCTLDPNGARGMCVGHYARFMKQGDTMPHKPLKRPHGLGHTAAYRSWANMKLRCYWPKHAQYKDYGGRGIAICPEWRDFTTFYADMGERPEGMTIERIDVNGNYEPSNCIWADKSTQSYNSRRRENIGRRGVFKASKGSRYYVRISKDAVLFNVGWFSNPDEAAWMYDQWALGLYEELAHLNFEYL